MAKGFQKFADKGEAGAPKPPVNLLGSLLEDDDDDYGTNNNSNTPESPANTPKPLETPKANEPKVTPAPQERPKREVKPKEEVVVQNVDKRKVEDKKVPFTNSLRGSILLDMEETILKYRKKIDIDYNIAQFLEEASLAQLEVLRKKIK